MLHVPITVDYALMPGHALSVTLVMEFPAETALPALPTVLTATILVLHAPPAMEDTHLIQARALNVHSISFQTDQELVRTVQSEHLPQQVPLNVMYASQHALLVI